MLLVVLLLLALQLLLLLPLLMLLLVIAEVSLVWAEMPKLCAHLRPDIGRERHIKVLSQYSIQSIQAKTWIKDITT